MYPFFKSFLFLLPPESAHFLSVKALKMLSSTAPGRWLIQRFYGFHHPDLEMECLGLRFQNPIGLAAGFDKDAKYVEAMAELGFGFIEIGTVTPRPQSGNPKPRLFRLPIDRGLINRMGFNNDGVDKMAERLKRIKKGRLILGGNIGKNKDTPNEKAHEDYLYCFMKLYDLLDYFVINISSPNTPGLRSLQESGPLKKLLSSLVEERNKKKNHKALLLKIAPDLNDSQLVEILEIVKASGIEGIIVNNTSISREELRTSHNEVANIGAGGLSGHPIQTMSQELMKKIKILAKDDLVLIGVGGIDSEQSAIQRRREGAQLIQLYTGLIYEGPGLIKRLKKAMVSH